MKERTPLVVKCSHGKGAGLRWGDPIAACGRFHAHNTTFDPLVGGSRKKRWLFKCKYCGKKTALNPEAGNIMNVRPDTMAAAKQLAEDFNRELGLI